MARMARVTRMARRLAHWQNSSKCTIEIALIENLRNHHLILKRSLPLTQCLLSLSKIPSIWFYFMPFFVSKCRKSAERSEGNKRAQQGIFTEHSISVISTTMQAD